MTRGNVLLHVGALVAPSLTREFAAITVIAELHDVIDADAAVAVVIVVGLPNAAEAVHGRFPVVAEIPTQSLEIRTVLVATKDHALLVGITTIVDLVSCLVDDRLAVLVLDLPSRVSEIEVEFPIGTEMDGMNAMIVLRTRNTGKKIHRCGIRFVVTILVREHRDAVTNRHHDLVSENAHSVGGVDITTLVEDLYFVRLVVPVGVFEDENPIAICPVVFVPAVVGNLAHPNAPAVVHVYGRRTQDHRFAGKQARFHFLVYVEVVDRMSGITLVADTSALFGHGPRNRTTD